MKNAVIYARYSSDKQTEMSIEGQIAECKKYAAENDMFIVREYVDRAFSATTDKRPDFQRMIADSEDNNFDTILVYQLDRFSRDRLDSGYYRKILRSHGVRVISVKEDYGDDMTSGILENTLEAFNEFFSKQLSVKVTRGMYQRAERFKYNGGTMTYGFTTNEEGYYIPDERKAPIVREIFQRVAEGETMKSVIDDLNARGIKTSKGNAFTRTSLQRMLRNDKYIGTYTYGDFKAKNAIPRIVTDEVFEAVQQVLKSHTHERRPAKEEFLLTGKLFCGTCKTQMIGTSGTSKTGAIHRYYTCANAINRGGSCDRKNIQKEMIEDAVIAACRDALEEDTIEALVEYVAKLNKADQESPEILRLQDEIKETEKRIEKLLDQMELGIDSERIGNRLLQREADLETLRANLKMEMRKQERIDPDVTRSFLQGMKDGRYGDSIKLKKLFIQTFVDRIYLCDDHFEIMWTFADQLGEVHVSLENYIKTKLYDPGSQILIDGVPTKEERHRRSFSFHTESRTRKRAPFAEALFYNSFLIMTGKQLTPNCPQVWQWKISGVSSGGTSFHPFVR